MRTSYVGIGTCRLRYLIHHCFSYIKWFDQGIGWFLDTRRDKDIDTLMMSHSPLESSQLADHFSRDILNLDLNLLFSTILEYRI